MQNRSIALFSDQSPRADQPIEFLPHGNSDEETSQITLLAGRCSGGSRRGRNRVPAGRHDDIPLRELVPRFSTTIDCCCPADRTPKIFRVMDMMALSRDALRLLICRQVDLRA